MAIEKAKNYSLKSILLANKELIAIAIAVFGFAIAVGEAMAIAGQGLSTAHEVHQIVVGTPGAPGISEIVRRHETIIQDRTAVVRAVEDHESRLVRVEENRYTAVEAAKDRELLRASIEAIRTEIQTSRSIIMERLTRLETKIEK